MALIPFSPAGYRIVGTSERILGTAYATVSRGIDGKPVIDYEGETKVHWDTQELVTQDGEIVFVDEAGNDVLESEVVWREAEQTVA